MANEETKKQKLGFTIIKNDPTDGHKGFGIGSLSLENVSPVIIDIQEKMHLLILEQCMRKVKWNAV